MVTTQRRPSSALTYLKLVLTSCVVLILVVSSRKKTSVSHRFIYSKLWWLSAATELIQNMLAWTAVVWSSHWLYEQTCLCCPSHHRQQIRRTTTLRALCMWARSSGTNEPLVVRTLVAGYQQQHDTTTTNEKVTFSWIYLKKPKKKNRTKTMPQTGCRNWTRLGKRHCLVTLH